MLRNRMMNWNPLGQADRYPISRDQRGVHMVSEAFAVFAVVPFMFFLATRRHLPRWARWGSAIIGAGTLVIDGGLLVKNWTNGGEET